MINLPQENNENIVISARYRSSFFHQVVRNHELKSLCHYIDRTFSICNGFRVKFKCQNANDSSDQGHIIIICIYDPTMLCASDK